MDVSMAEIKSFKVNNINIDESQMNIHSKSGIIIYI